MPNVVADLHTEMNRVRLLLDGMDLRQRDEAREAIRYGRQSITAASLEAMQDALSDLRELGKSAPQK